VYPNIAEDIDELRLAYAESLNTIKIISDELEKQKVLLSNLFNLAPEPYLLLNGDGVITQVNLMSTNLFGMSSERMVGHKLSDFLLLNSTRNLELFLDKLAQRQVHEYIELKFERPDKTVLHTRLRRNQPRTKRTYNLLPNS
jgi:PAS domain S-box-containing protein